MINMTDILETIKMIQEDNLDIRTITMGISLLDCAERRSIKRGSCTRTDLLRCSDKDTGATRRKASTANRRRAKSAFPSGRGGKA